ncbi:MAG: glyoxalase [Nocardioidaceae bacterium]|nr:glyoxalase [Nocardioidaceae bacterium]
MTALHHVQVSCPKGGEPAVSRFYADLLGLVEVAKPSELAKRGGVWFRGDGYELHVGVETPFLPAAKAHPAFLVDDVDELAAQLTCAGCKVTWDSNFPGYRRFHTRDPHGNRVELLGVELLGQASSSASTGGI